ncbi:DUF4149 domain-containing protein [Ectopseudomonas mendocina]|uniref:DUF4149 domain-containing protein n=2 Tax=Ectopseudomonas mendocina TaxID=300 RepID=A0A2R3QRC6_ECTME|nr:DUF4149 domain-containing protein [Pseudomonas mendocina]
MSKSVTSRLQRSSKPAAMAWQLALPLWVGGLWAWQFVLLPAIGQFGLAPLLVQEIASHLTPVLVALTAVCIGIQSAVLLRCEGFVSLWRDMRGQLLLTVALMALSYWLAPKLLEDASYWLRFSYLVMAFSGLLLVLQPVPGRERQS